MHNWCVQVDQPNCHRNADCPDPSKCFVHAEIQRRWTDEQCYQDTQKKWRFSIFDVADCSCDCAQSAFPPPPDGPGGITVACSDGSVNCSSCTEPSEEE